jgi:ParB family transcriptional regulator, chromosome partitioning protein
MTQNFGQSVEMISVDLIDVVNPRVRNRKIFREITASIAELGLKKPITVTRRAHLDGTRYSLVCGQGRLEAFSLLASERSQRLSSTPIATIA